jgi:rubredoxin
LNWQLENACPEGLDLKKQLVREFEEYDLRTYRLCFAIKTRPKSGLPGSVILKKSGEDRFDILYTRDFNPNSKDYVTYKKDLERNKLGGSLIELCNFYYSLLMNNNFGKSQSRIDSEEEKVDEIIHLVYQCKNCLSVYDEVYGDSFNDIPSNTPFETLADYCCPVCESPKDDFLAIEKRSIPVSFTGGA